MSCNDSKKFVTSEASTKAWMRTRGIIDKYLNILDYEKFTRENNRLSKVAQNRYYIKGKLFGEEPTAMVKDIYSGGTRYNWKVVPNRQAFKDIDNAKGIYYQLPGDTVGSTASKETIKVVNDFLNRIGVDVNRVKQIKVDGVAIDGNAVADMTRNLIEVVEGKEASSLPEEAMHFFVNIIEQTNPSLFNKLLKEINDYNILKQVFSDYSTNPNYQTKDGKPDVLKLKKEAIGKILAETIIKKNEGVTERPELLKKTTSWWEQFIEWFKGLIVKSGFDRAAKDIILGKETGTAEDINEAGIYLQKSTQAQIYDKIKEINSIVVKDDDGYLVNGKRTKRVTDLVKSWYERRFTNKDLTKSEYQQSVDDLKKEKGTAGHHDLEYAFKLFVDENGYLRDVPLSDEGYVSELNPENRDMYELLRNNLQERLQSFPEGTRFMSEATVYDAKRNIAGTVDFLAITVDGKVSVLDWKFMDLNTTKYKDVPWYKVNAWNTQMDQYKYIIARVYNVKNEDFQQTRMIPIKATYTEGNRKTGVLPKLLNVKIGSVNVKNIEEDYLLPVSLETEKTGNKKIDALLEKLNTIYKKFSEQKVITAEKQNKAEQLNALFYAIRQLQMKENIKPLLHQAKILNKQIRGLIDKYNNDFKGKSRGEFSEQEISDFVEKIEVGRNSIATYTNLEHELKFLFQGELSEEDEILRNELRDTTGDARELEDELTEVDTEFITEFIGGTSDPEKIIKGITKYFSGTATLQLKSLEALYKKTNKIFAYVGIDVNNEVRRLTELKNSYEKWANSRGLSLKNMFDIIKKKNKNELIDEFNSEFYSNLREKTHDKDFQWIRDNIDTQAYIEHINEKKKQELERVDDKLRNGLGTQQEKREHFIAKQKTIDLYNISSVEGIGWLLYDELKKFPKRELWESQEWKTLNRPENKPAKDFYDYIKERNEYYRDIDYIHAKQARTFLPWVRQGTVEKMIFGGKSSIGEQFLRNISVDEGDTGYGKIDPLTGKPIDNIPKYLTTELEGDYSTDLFKTMALYNEFAIKFKYLSEIEAQARALVRLEQNKKAIATSFFGKTEYKDGILQINPDNTENTKLVENMVKAIIYQQRYIESESFDQLLGKVGNTGEKINKKLGFKLLPENLQDRQVSINKSITQLNNMFQLTKLGLNPLSSLSNLFGGKTQSLINSGKYFTKLDFISAEMWLLAHKMGGEDKQKMLAALDYFMPFTENYNRDAAKKLSLGNITEQGVQDFLMSLMRKGDRAVQVTNFYAFARNTIVQDGKIVNTREYLRNSPEYQNFYSGTSEERKARELKFEEDVKKLNEEKGILKLGKVEKGRFVLEGINQKDDSVINFRRNVQQFTSDALGNMSEENVRLVNLSVYGKSFMVFKNWIPRLVDVRMGNLKYNSATDAYEWGRTRMIMRVISEDLTKAIGNLEHSLRATDRGIEFMRELYEKKKQDYELDTGKELEMTESEFIDMVRQNIRNQMLDALVLATLFALTLGLKALPPDDDEDERIKNNYRFILKATDKLKDELQYFYDPTSYISLLSSGIFPSLTLLADYRRTLGHFMTESFALMTGDEEKQDKNNVIKYWMRSFPITDQISRMLPIFYPELAKDLGIRMQSQYGTR